MSKAWRAYALHVLDAIAKVRRIQQRGNLADDEVLYDAALRNLQTLSEAIQMLPDDLKALYPAIPWRDKHPLAASRNLHEDYAGRRY